MTVRLHPADAIAIVVLLLFVAVLGSRVVGPHTVPVEDAAILMRYAEHFAHGHGIVWNIGERPIDGATDFLFMIVVGLVVRAGLSVEAATQVIGLASHVLTVVIVYAASRRLFHAWVVPAFCSALYLAVGPGLSYVAACFGTPMFALFAAVTWYAALSIVLHGESWHRSLAFCGSALATGLIRPEGVILAGLMLVAVGFLTGLRRARLTIVCFVAIFALVGGLYFVWRWSYFGFPLPNPFYKKSAGVIHYWSLKHSIENTVAWCWPFVPIFILGLYARATARLTVGFSIPIVGFVAAFALISDELNFFGRYQYAVLPIVLMCWWPLIEPVLADLRPPAWRELSARKRVAVALLVLVVAGGIVHVQYTATRWKRHADGQYDLAVMLSEFRARNFTLATTEAGVLPLYSRWRSLDTWGLNDQWIAHHGRVTDEYLDRHAPHVLMFHARFSPLVPDGGTGRWADMVRTLKRYAETRGYVLAAVFGENPYDTHYYYVRSDFPESADIVRRIRAIDYLRPWRRTVNYAVPAGAQTH